MLDGKRKKNGQPTVRHFLIFDGAADNNIVVAIAPVVGNTFHETVNSLSEKEKAEVATPLDHLPTLGPPLVGIFQKEIRGETGENDFAAFNLP